MPKAQFSEAEEARLDAILKTKKGHEKQRDEYLQKLAQLEQKVIESQAAYGAIYNRRTPLLTLPPEITCVIFQNTKVLRWIEDGRKSKEYMPMEVVVSHVCRQWRTTALQFPNIWTTFYTDSYHIKPHASESERLALYLTRSASQLLELWFDFRNSDNKALSSLHLNMVYQALAHVERWRRVTILFDHQSSISPTIFASFQLLQAPNLEYLSFRPDLPYYAGPADLDLLTSLTHNIFLNGTPKLTSVWLDASSPFICLPPLTNVTTMRLEFVGAPNSAYPWATFPAILSIPTLEYLSLVSLIFDDPETDDIELITMDNLKDFRYSDIDFIGVILPYFRAPKLETLTIQGSEIGGETPFSTMNLDKSYFFPSLTSLRLSETTTGSSEEAFAFAQLTRTATHVLVSYDQIEDCILVDIFIDAEMREKVWPRLKMLTCNLACNTEDVLEQLTLFAATRPPKSVSLQILDNHVRHWKENFKDRLEELNELCDIHELNSDRPLITGTWPPGEGSKSAYLVADITEDPFYICRYY